MFSVRPFEYLIRSLHLSPSSSQLRMLSLLQFILPSSQNISRCIFHFLFFCAKIFSGPCPPPQNFTQSSQNINKCMRKKFHRKFQRFRSLDAWHARSKSSSFHSNSDFDGSVNSKGEKKIQALPYREKFATNLFFFRRRMSCHPR